MPRLIGVTDLHEPGPVDPNSLRPPPRFATAAFETYHPQHATQSAAREAVSEFVLGRSWPHEEAAGRRQRRWWPFGAHRKAEGAGLYLDGGFGVGKTHLLAAAYSAADTHLKRYLSFQELVYLIGVMGMARAKEELATSDLLCIDEFELDDPGNTLMVKTFLSALLEGGGAVVTTSNTPPAAQGQGRFNAEDFKREIQSLADGFDVIRVDGPDYRHRERLGDWLTGTELQELAATERSRAPRLYLTWDELEELLTSMHPTRYGGVLTQVGTVYLSGVRPIPSLNDALRFVHFIDKLYDMGVGLRASSAAGITRDLLGLFDESYLDGAYAKKHHRCLSRLSELLAEGLPAGSGEAQASEPLREVVS